MAADAHSDPVAALEEQARRYSPERHPLQHATAQFHLGGFHLAQGRLEAAEGAFTAAAALFGARGARPEQAKALNGLGATLRAAGRPELAARALEHAIAGLARAGLALEEGAARYNLGLVLNEHGRGDLASEAFAEAVRLLDPARAPAEAAAAARELGAARLALGDLEGARAALEDAVDRAERAGDQAGRAAAANALGLAAMAGGRTDEAIEVFLTAVAASPRAVRPEAFAVAKANLALAWERAGAPARARLAARQALASPGAPQPVRAQAADVLGRLGEGGDDLAAALAAEPSDEGRARIVREELLRSADGEPDEQVADMREWVAALVASEGDPAHGAELWLGGLLELPPQGLERLVHGAVVASMELDEDARDTFRSAVVRAMARFHIPQWMRLQDVFSVAAREAGDTGSWR